MAKTTRFFSALAVVGCTAALAAFLSCSGGTDGVDVDDDSYPSQIADLRVKSVTASTVTLEWTAPGDDDTVGTAAAYDMRYSASPVTWVNWDSVQVIKVPGEPDPSPFGSTDTMRVTGLTENVPYYFALKSRGHSGQSSWLSNCAPAMCFDDYVVAFPDPHLDQVIRTTIVKPTGDIHRSELLQIVFLEANSRSITNLSGLEYCINLEGFLLNGNSVSDLAPLAGLVRLRGFQAFANDISDISPLAGLVNLEQLSLADNAISDISAMSGMTKLTHVILSSNDITDISALAGKSAVTILQLDENQISDIGALSGMTNLTELRLRSNQISAIGALSGMTKLSVLDLYNNKITAVNSLAGLASLREAYINENQIADLSPLSGLTGLERLYAGNNPISDVSDLSGLTTLIELNLQQCQVSDLTPLQGLIGLNRLVLVYNLIVDIAPLVANSGLQDGDYLYLAGNQLDSASTDTYVPLLKERGVILDI